MSTFGLKVSGSDNSPTCLNALLSVWPSELADLFDEQDEAVKWMIRNVISVAKRTGRKIGLCGQAPSNHPAFAAFLVEAGINSVSVSPDSFVEVKKHVAAAEKAFGKGR